MGEVVELGCETTLEIPPDKVLKAAVGNLDQVLVLGYDKNGDEYFAASMANRAHVLWLMERLRLGLLSGEVG